MTPDALNSSANRTADSPFPMLTRRGPPGPRGLRGPRGSQGETGAAGAAAPSVTVVADFTTGNAIANTLTLTTFTEAQATVTGALDFGTGYIGRIGGTISTTGTPTGRFVVRLAGSAVNLLDTGAKTLGTYSSAGWCFDYWCGVRTIGATGTMTAHGVLTINGAIIAQVRAAPITVNTTGANIITHQWQWGAASALNTLSIEAAIIRKEKL